MSAAVELLKELGRRGVVVEARGDRLRYRPRSVVSPELADRIRSHKAELLSILTVERPAAASSPPTESKFRFTSEIMDFGDICAGWTPAGWAKELRRKSACCDEIRPDISADYLAWAEDIERRMSMDQ
ncbi:MAG: hypothetical protein IID33_13055 [Planctomycetes bacterium]|nr:hypothetical protein [Planctomycetota bacterium]